jgi:hypothetical protein
MFHSLPDYLEQGEQARLFPVLSSSSKEGQATSIVLACFGMIDALGATLLKSVGQNIGARTKIETYTEIVFKTRPKDKKDRPDGLIILRTGSREWRALVETKIKTNNLDAKQIETYRQLAKDNGIDCVITISNQFATTPTAHPVPEVTTSRSKIKVYHWSWMYVMTTVDLLLNQGGVSDLDQKMLLNELRRFLTHDSAGVKGFDRMPKEWGELNRLVSTGGVIAAKSQAAQAVVGAWHQETRDLTLILSRLTETNVSQRLSRKHLNDAEARKKDEIELLRATKCLTACIEIPDAAAPLEVVADMTRRAIDVGMTLRAPEDKISTKARVNWLLRQVKADHTDHLYLRLMWPGKNEPTQHPINELRANVDIAGEGKDHIAPHSFHLFSSISLGARFAQQTNFIADLETSVPDFYRDIGGFLSAWKKPAPKIKHEKPAAGDVTPEAISDDAEDFGTSAY